MIAYLRGTVKFRDKDFCILDVNGVGYKVFLDEQSRQGLQLDSPTELIIHSAVRQDAINLFGFKERTTLELFELLLNVSGIGTKSALAIVSKISTEDFARLVAAQDINALSRLPGIGKKSAERICLELKDKITIPINSQSAQIQSSVQEEAAQALEALGYTASEITFKGAPPNSSTEQLIKFALKNLNRFA